MDSAKQKIESVVTNYKALHNTEYRLFINSLKKKRVANRNVFASFSSDDFLERKMAEIPDTLFRMMRASLEDIEFSWLFPQNDPSAQGLKWFLRRFPEFKSAEKI